VKLERKIEMKDKGTFYSATFAVVILFLILVSSTASASISETRITTSGKATNSAIYGNNVVWQDTRNGNSAIYMLDTSTKKETHVTDKTNQIEPAIYGNKIVYVNNGTNICMYDLSTNKETTIVSNLPYFGVDEPAIYGNLITYDDDTPDGIDAKIGIYNISTHQDNQLSGGTGDHWDSAIYGNKIVWTNGEPTTPLDGVDIYMYDPSTFLGTPISTSGKAESPAIYGNKIVWQDKRNGNWNIYMYDLSTKKETQITTSSADSVNPVIYGNNLVWDDNRSGNWNIYALDLVTHQQIHTTDKSDQTMPAIYANKIVWTDYRNGNPDIYMGTISYLPVAAFTVSPTTGTHPLTVTFTDKSTDVYYWNWNFGDKTTSTLQSPVHKYTKAGKYTVTLTVKNAAGSNTKTMSITVK
jgi:beta propeller repeat protein